jgi:hypothetical protein
MSASTRRRALRAWALLSVALIATGAEAATYTWTAGGGVNVNWSNPLNWGGSGPTNGEVGVELVSTARRPLLQQQRPRRTPAD